MYTLEHHRELAYRAHSNISFSPEKRAESIIKEFSDQLDSDILELQKSLETDRINHYRLMYENHFTTWLSAKSNCISSAITGGSNFPVKKAEKANQREHNKYTEFQDFRKRFFESVAKQNRKQAIVAAGGELEIARKKLIELNEFHESMKRVNKAYKAYLKNPDSINDKSDLTDLEKQTVTRYVSKNSWEHNPYPPYMLTNNNAKIKNTEARIKELEYKDAAKESDVEYKTELPDGYILVNYQADRIQIFNNQRPEPAVIISYKKHGLKWSSFNKCWQRQITGNAFFSLENLFNLKINKK